MNDESLHFEPDGAGAQAAVRQVEFQNEAAPTAADITFRLMGPRRAGSGYRELASLFC